MIFAVSQLMNNIMYGKKLRYKRKYKYGKYEKIKKYWY